MDPCGQVPGVNLQSSFFLDISAVFDVVDHPLLETLSSYVF